MSPEIENYPILGEYTYVPIAQGENIRLLTLSPGNRGHTISCTLKTVPLKDVWRTYESISYVWGNPSKRFWILVNEKRMAVNLSVFQALQQFRDEKEEKTFWLDAVCIMQTNPPEKGHQVQLMAKIYEGASRVKVWIGPDETGVGPETTKFIHETVQAAHKLRDIYGSIEKVPTLSNLDNPVSQDPQKWKLYENFLNLPWFTRVWVIQEVGVAAKATMHWGDAEMEFSDVINVNEFLFHAQHLFSVYPMSWSLHDAFYGLFNLYDNEDSWRNQLLPEFPADGKRLVPEPNLLDVLIQGSRRGATDIRDHVFAFLGHPLSKRGDEFIILADYSRDVDDVFLEVTARLIDWNGPTIPLVQASGMGDRNPRNLDSSQPSWVIRWELGHLVNQLGRPEHWFTAGGTNGVTTVDIDKSAATLTMSGCIFDRVVWTSEIILPSDIGIDSLISNPSHRSAVDWIWHGLEQVPCRYPESYKRDAMTLCLVAGRHGAFDKAEDDLPHHQKTTKGYAEYIAFARSKNSGGSPGTSASDATDVDEAQLRTYARDFEDGYAWTAPNRRFFVTEKGSYGLGPPLLREKDEIAIFQGINVPFTLRQVEGSGYKLVGVAYVHGIMGGELLDPNHVLNREFEGFNNITIV